MYVYKNHYSITHRHNNKYVTVKCVINIIMIMYINMFIALFQFNIALALDGNCPLPDDKSDGPEGSTWGKSMTLQSPMSAIVVPAPGFLLMMDPNSSAHLKSAPVSRKRTFVRSTLFCTCRAAYLSWTPLLLREFSVDQIVFGINNHPVTDSLCSQWS